MNNPTVLIMTLNNNSVTNVPKILLQTTESKIKLKGFDDTLSLELKNDKIVPINDSVGEIVYKIPKVLIDEIGPVFAFHLDDDYFFFPLTVCLSQTFKQKMVEDDFIYFDETIMSKCVQTEFESSFVNEKKISGEKLKLLYGDDQVTMAIFKFEVKNNIDMVEFIRPLIPEIKNPVEYSFPVITVSSPNVFETIVSHLDNGCRVFVTTNSLSGIISTSDLIIMETDASKEKPDLEKYKLNVIYKFSRDLLSEIYDVLDYDKRQIDMMRFNILNNYFCSLGYFFTEENRDDMYIEVIEKYCEDDHVLDKLAEYVDLLSKLTRYFETFDVSERFRREILDCSNEDEVHRIMRNYDAKID